MLTTFCMALAAWGLGFYSLSVYVQYLAAAGRFSAELLSAATTLHFLAGAAALYAVDAAAARFGRRPLVMAGVLLMAGCASPLAHAGSAFGLIAAYVGMAFGWAAISGAAITQIVGLWFHDRRGLALNVALTGASAAGFVVVPALVAAIERFGLGTGVMLVSALLALVLAAFNLVEPSPRAAAAVGNVITLPALFVQREFAPQIYAKVVTRVWSVGELMYAFGPLGAGLLLGATGSPAVPLLACLGCQLAAAASCFRGRPVGL